MRSPAEASPSFVFVPDLPGPGAEADLSEAESHYLSRVCRAREGDRFTATDGAGRRAELEVVRLGRTLRVLVRAVERIERARRAEILCGAPEGERADWMVEKLAELGIDAFQPIECERSSWRHSRGERWRRLAVAALRQSRRCHLMEVREPVALEAALSRVPAESERWLGSQDGPAGARFEAPGALTVGVIGPAAGLSARERSSIDASGFLPICLSDARLRAETAAIGWALWWSSRCLDAGVGGT